MRPLEMKNSLTVQAYLETRWHKLRLAGSPGTSFQCQITPLRLPQASASLGQPAAWVVLYPVLAFHTGLNPHARDALHCLLESAIGRVARAATHARRGA